MDLMQKLPNVKRITIEPPAKRLIVVGDLHGQLDDLLLIFKREGLPSPSNPYLINGDFVDRGDHSIEIALIIFAYQLLYPGSFHINRGNHEDRSINRVYGFMRECLAKYDVDVFDEFIEVFNWLPIVTIVNDRVCVLHGGLCRSGADLETINAVPRHLFRPARKAAAQLSTSMGGLPAAQQPGEPGKEQMHHHEDAMQEDPEDDALELQLMDMRDILWADPQPRSGFADNKRGAGCMFGPDVTLQWLERNGMDLLIRSHECVPNGFDWPFARKEVDAPNPSRSASVASREESTERKLLTVFSASNYCGQANNQGAYAVLPAESPHLPECHAYLASGTESDIEVHNMALLVQEIVKAKPQLYAAFEKADTQRSGQVTLALWVQTMTDVLDLNLQWRTLQPMLCELLPNDFVDFREFLDRYDVKHGSGGITKDANSAILNQLYPHREQLEGIFRSFDADGNGTLSFDEFSTGCRLLNEHLPAGQGKFEDPSMLWNLLNINNQVGAAFLSDASFCCIDIVVANFVSFMLTLPRFPLACTCVPTHLG